MDLGTDRQNGAALPFDWHGLRARLLAAQACRQAFADADEPARGSFDPATARAIAAYEEPSRPVNPTGLGDRKGADGTRSVDAATAAAGVRGQDD
ncbi:MAG: hypothetical protein JF593_04490 [Novosphingobium sp.]|nr:hypothetical protein [Novosphingobium sp.]